MSRSNSSNGNGSRTGENNSEGGVFSATLMSVQLQMKTLLEGAGGDKAVRLLDALSSLSNAEQEIALTAFDSAIRKISSGETRYSSDEDKALRAFEEELYNGLVSDIEQAKSERAEETSTSKVKLSVYDGGRSATLSGFKRGIKKSTFKPVLVN
jgi:hypothetical protein